MPSMRMITDERLNAAERFVWTSGRLVDRLRFGHLVRDTPAARVVDALRPYQNADGGFGEALEPDFRGPISEPVTVESALSHLDEIGVFDADMVARACDYLASVSTPEGAVPFVLGTVTDYPRSPWWQPQPGEPPCLLPTAPLAGLLHRNGVDHPWLAPATRWCWGAIDEFDKRLAGIEDPSGRLQMAYEARAAVQFLDDVPDRERAAAAGRRLGQVLIDRGVLVDDPGDDVEVETPLDFAAHPSSIARAWFDEATIDRQLDALVDAQRPDGGWTFAWEVWTPVTEFEWRSRLTVDRLATLKAYGRVDGFPGDVG